MVRTKGRPSTKTDYENLKTNTWNSSGHQMIDRRKKGNVSCASCVFSVIDNHDERKPDSTRNVSTEKTLPPNQLSRQRRCAGTLIDHRGIQGRVISRWRCLDGRDILMSDAFAWPASVAKLQTLTRGDHARVNGNDSR